jgi:hypothetical protein
MVFKGVGFREQSMPFIKVNFGLLALVYIVLRKNVKNFIVAKDRSLLLCYISIPLVQNLK